MNPETKLITAAQAAEATQEVYTPPAMIAEGELEVRAGSPLGDPDPFDLFED